jgi:hypothetical protein
MYCPACGTHLLDSQKFCRACGMALNPVSELVGAHLSSSAEGALVALEARTKSRHKKLERIGTTMGSLGILLILLLLTAFFIGLGLSKVFTLDLSLFDIIAPVVLSISLPLIFVGSGLALLPALYKQLGGSGAAQPPALPPKVTTRELTDRRPAEELPQGSVTEQTTRALEVVKHERRANNLD